MNNPTRVSNSQSPRLQAQAKFKFPDLNAGRSATLSLLLLIIPFLLFIHRVVQDVLNVSLSSGWSWPFWLRVTLKSLILIVIPLTAAIINLLSTRMKAVNIVIAIVSASVAILFTIVMITD